MKNVTDKLNALAVNNNESIDAFDILFILKRTIPELDILSNDMTEPLDYAIVNALNYATKNVAKLHILRPQIERYWLKINAIPGGDHYDVVLSAARFLAKWHQMKLTPTEAFKTMAYDENWRNRLVAACYIREANHTYFEEEISVLRKDPFVDDNNFYLVREALGI